MTNMPQPKGPMERLEQTRDEMMTAALTYAALPFRTVPPSGAEVSLLSDDLDDACRTYIDALDALLR